MPMCTFGCDNLYELGYIAVKEGKIVDMGEDTQNARGRPLYLINC
jgi:hypothetical protein